MVLGACHEVAFDVDRGQIDGGTEHAGGTGLGQRVGHGDLDEIAWNADNSGRQRLDGEGIWKEGAAHAVDRLNENGNNMHEVGQKRANGFGLSDMLGNADEWVNDWYDEKYYQSSPSQDPAGPASGQERVLRGANWGHQPRGVRVSFRFKLSPGYRSGINGFRCGGEVAVP